MDGREPDAGHPTGLEAKPVSRRRFLALGGAVATFALAGCSGPTGGSSHAEWVPSSDGCTLVAYMDLTLTQSTSSIDPIVPLVLPSNDASEPAEFVPDLSGLDDIDDPLLRFPLQTGGQIVGVSTLSLAFAGLGHLVDPANETREVTELIVANNTIVGSGDIDVGKADDALRSGTPGPFGENVFEVVEHGDEFTYYRLAGDVSGTVALSESSVVVAEARTEVRRVVDAKNGDHARAVAEDDTFDWLLDTAGPGDLGVGWLGPLQLGEFYWGSQEPSLPTDLVSTEDDVAASVTFAPESDEVTAEFALRRSGLEDDAANRLERRLGASSIDTTVTTERDRLSATGTYAGEALDVEFVQPRDTPTATPVPRGDDIPTSVAEAVPENTFEFVYQEETNRVRVNFVRDFEADSVTVRATQSASETSSSTPGPITYLTVGVDPAGDEVVVIVTIDGESGVVARQRIPPSTPTGN